jgi:hypothetical protein
MYPAPIVHHHSISLSTPEFNANCAECKYILPKEPEPKHQCILRNKEVKLYNKCDFFKRSTGA